MLQNIINHSNQLVINRRRVIGVQYTRNEILKTAQTPTINPWKFTVKAANGFVYSEVRDMLEELDRLDRNNYEFVTFSGNGNMSWMFAYRGVMDSTAISAITITSFSGNQLVLGNLPALDPSAVLFQPNDIIQVGSFCFTSTTQVLRGNSATVTITTHRPYFASIDPAGHSIVVGNSVSFPVICVNMPTYKLIPGAFRRNQTTGVITNNAIVEFDSDFELVEYTGA
jgi:hypothetical protein